MGARAGAANAMKFEVSHRTTYGYGRPVAQSQHQLHLKPRNTPWQTVYHHSLLIEPAPAGRCDIVDAFGNAATLLLIMDEHSEFIVHARSTVQVKAAPVPVLSQTLPWETVAKQVAQPGRGVDLDVMQFTVPSNLTPVSHDIAAFAQAVFTPGRPVLAGAMALTEQIFREFKFDATATDISTPVARVLRLKRGVCQDFAHLSLAALRSLGIPARYVSGYLLTRPPPGQIKLKGSDASHAWLSVYAPGVGWVDFDPTNGIIPSVEHITVAYGRDYDDISPVSGVLLGGSDQTMMVSVDVEAVG